MENDRNKIWYYCYGKWMTAFLFGTDGKFHGGDFNDFDVV